HMLPLPPGMATTMPTPQSDASISPHMSSHLYGQYSAQVTPMPPEHATPWWVWFAGGAFAVGLGIAGAVWYANREPAPAPAPAPAPVVQPALVLPAADKPAPEAPH